MLSFLISARKSLTRAATVAAAMALTACQPGTIGGGWTHD